MEASLKFNALAPLRFAWFSPECYGLKNKFKKKNNKPPSENGT